MGKKPPKTLLGVFDLIPDPDEFDDFEDKTLEDFMNGPMKKKIEEVEGFIETFKIQELAFGAKKIIARLIFKEKAGGTQFLEDAILTFPQMMRAECGMVTIIS